MLCYSISDFNPSLQALAKADAAAKAAAKAAAEADAASKALATAKAEVCVSPTACATHSTHNGLPFRMQFHA